MGTQEYWYLVEAYRNEDGEPAQRAVAYLGKQKGRRAAVAQAEERWGGPLDQPTTRRKFKRKP